MIQVIVLSAIGLSIAQIPPELLQCGVVQRPAWDEQPDDNFSPVAQVWSADFHISPIQDVKHIFSSWDGVRVVDRSMSGVCHTTKTCGRTPGLDRKRLLSNQLGMSCEDRKQFFDVAINNKELMRTDLFICQHAFGLCQAFMALGKPMVLIASTRYEVGNYNRERWKALDEDVRLIALRYGNVIAANNMFDLHYLTYFTGIRNVLYLPSLCNYVTARYKGTRPEVLIMGTKNHPLPGYVLRELKQAGQRAGVQFKELQEVIRGRYTHEQISEFKAVIFIPYQVSTMTFFELYAMGMPMFVPSTDLLFQFHLRFEHMRELTWACLRAGCGKPPIRGRHMCTTGYTGNPLCDKNETSMLYWLQFSDWYQVPGVEVFGSSIQAAEGIGKANLTSMSKTVLHHMVERTRGVHEAWKSIFYTLSTLKQQKAWNNSIHSHDFRTQMLSQWGDSVSCT